MAASAGVDPVDRMLAAVLAAGECQKFANASFSERWRVQLRGAEARFAEVTGNRLVLRGLIRPHPMEKSDSNAPIVRFVPTATQETAVLLPPRQKKKLLSQSKQTERSRWSTLGERRARTRANQAHRYTKQARERHALATIKCLNALEAAISALLKPGSDLLLTPWESRRDIISQALTLRSLLDRSRAHENHDPDGAT